MLKQEPHFSFPGLIRILSMITIITFAFGAGACSSGGESTSASGSAQ